MAIRPVSTNEKGLKGFTCKCGTFHTFGAYVAAHTHLDLVHTCSECGRKHIVRNYVVRSYKEPKR